MSFNTSTQRNTKIGKNVSLPAEELSSESSVDRREEIVTNCQ